jgi:hypothetical protein
MIQHYPSDCLSLSALSYVLHHASFFFQFEITEPDTGKVEVDQRFGLEPYLHKV